jgi:hypothetical protein
MAKSAIDLYKNGNKETMSARELEAHELIMALARLISYKEI